MKNYSRIISSVLLGASIVLSQPAFASSSVPNQSNAAPAEQLPSGIPVEAERKAEIISAINEAMEEVKNFEYSSEIFIESQQGTSVIKNEGIADIEKGESQLSIEIMGTKTKSFIRDGKNYILDLKDNKYRYFDQGEEGNLKNSIMLKDTAADIVSIEELSDGGFVIKNNEPISLTELSEIIGNPAAEQQVEGENAPVAAIFYEIGSDYRFKRAMIAVMAPTADGKIASRTVTKTFYRNYNEAPEIVFPEELDSAEPLEMENNTTVSEQP